MQFRTAEQIRSGLLLNSLQFTMTYLSACLFLQKEIDLLSVSETSGTVSSAPPTVNLFASPETVARPEAKIPKPEPMTTPSIVDPFAAVPMENFDGTDPFGAFTSHSASVSTGPQAPVLLGSATSTTSPMSLAGSKPHQLQKNDPFQVKSGILADSLSRGLIDLNITARKSKLSLNFFLCTFAVH